MKNIVLFSVLVFSLLIEGTVTPAYGMKRQMEALDRGLVAVKTENGVFISWRVLGNEKNVAFNVYKNGKLFKSVSAGQATNLTDKSGNIEDRYVVKAVVKGKETGTSKEVKPWEPGIPDYTTKPSGERNYPTMHRLESFERNCPRISGGTRIYLCSGRLQHRRLGRGR